RVAVAGHAARRSERDISLAVRFERGIREKGRGRRAVHIRLLLEVGIGSEFWFGIRDLFPCTSEVTRPLGTEQHVIFPDRAFEDAMYLIVDLFRILGQRGEGTHLALGWSWEFHSEL